MFKHISIKNITIGIAVIFLCVLYFFYVFHSVPQDDVTGKRIKEIHTTQVVDKNNNVVSDKEKEDFLSNQPHQTPEAYPYKEVDKKTSSDPDTITTTITTTLTKNR